MEIINIGIVAHVDAGKTTITEHLLYHGGVLRTIGSVDDGTSQTDFMEIERARGISIQSSCVSIMTPNKQLNIIDTPGHIDFVAEVERALSILDAAVLVISAVEGIQSQTELLYEALKATHTNVIIFINKIDRVGSNVELVISKLREKFSEHTLLCSHIDREGEKPCESNFIFKQSENLELLSLAIADFDEEVMEDYLSGEPISQNILMKKLKEHIHNGNILPILCGSGSYDVGINELYHFILEYISPIKNRSDDKLSALVYKVTHDKTMGRIAHVRLFGGSIKNRDTIYLPGSEDGSKITQIRRYSGSKYINLGEAIQGDIVALCGLSNAKISDIIGEVQDKLGYHLSISFSKPTVIYRETPSRKGHGSEHYTMPKPCWAIIHLDIEPLSRGSGLEYSSVVANNKMFYRYQKHVSTAVNKALKQGMYNWEVTDLKVTLVDGEHHTVHTHPMDFFLATPLAIMDALRTTGTSLLEPVQTLDIIAPEEYVGKIIGDLIAMRGQFDSPVINSGRCYVKAYVPVSTSLEYSVRLASLTSGKGLLSTRFSGYQECPLELGAIAKRRGVNPLDRDKWILNQRNALN